jgi:hypothetical protein
VRLVACTQGAVGQGGTVHRAAAPRRRRPARCRLSGVEPAGGHGGGRGDVADLRAGPRSEPSRPARAGPARQLPGEADAEGIHPQAGWAAVPVGGRRAGGQDPAARRRRGAERHLRGGLHRLLLRIPARARPARCAGRAGGRDLPEGELGARRGCPRLLHQRRSRLAEGVPRAPHRRQKGAAPDPEMAQRRGHRGGEAVEERERDGAGSIGIAAARQRLPALRLRPLGPPMETPPRARRGDHRALRRRSRGGV